MSIFRWETLREISRHDLGYDPPVPGSVCEVELVSGSRIRVWRATDGQAFFCHGLTFGGKEAPGGPVSPFSGDAVETILRDLYERIPEAQARAGDILVWRGIPSETTPHSAVLVDAVLAPGEPALDYATRLRTKNGIRPERTMSLGRLVRICGESYQAYRRR